MTFGGEEKGCNLSYLKVCCLSKASKEGNRNSSNARRSFSTMESCFKRRAALLLRLLHFCSGSFTTEQGALLRLFFASPLWEHFCLGSFTTKENYSNTSSFSSFTSIAHWQCSGSISVRDLSAQNRELFFKISSFHCCHRQSNGELFCLKSFSTENRFETSSSLPHWQSVIIIPT